MRGVDSYCVIRIVAEGLEGTDVSRARFVPAASSAGDLWPLIGEQHFVNCVWTHHGSDLRFRVPRR